MASKKTGNGTNTPVDELAPKLAALALSVFGPGKQPAQRKLALRLAAAGWNLAVAREAGREDAFGEVEETGADLTAAKALVEKFAARKLELFAGDHRVVVDVLFEEQPGDEFTFTVAATAFRP